MSADKYFTDNVADKLSGDDDLEDLEKNGKGLVTGRVPEDKERPAWLSSFIRYYCSNCNKGIHNTPENDLRCKRRGCECRCQTHYIGQDGIARPYGIPDDSAERAKKLETKYTPQSDAEFQKLMEEYRKTRDGKEPEPTSEAIV